MSMRTTFSDTTNQIITMPFNFSVERSIGPKGNLEALLHCVGFLLAKVMR